MKKKVSIISADFSGGQGKKGVEKGPEFLLEKGQLASRLGLVSDVRVVPSLHLHDDDDKTITDEGDVPVESRETPTTATGHSTGTSRLYLPHAVSKANERLFHAICEERHRVHPDVVITLGGDHSISIGSILATKDMYPDVCVIWVDAHADINTPETTPSGNLHGMPLGFLCNIDRCLETSSEFQWMYATDTRGSSSATASSSSSKLKESYRNYSKHLDERHLAYIGLRDVDEEEAKVLQREHGPISYTSKEVTLMGIQSVMSSLLAKLPPNTPIHLSFDIDALDPNYAPSTGTPVADGLHLEDALYIMKCIGETGRLVSLDLVEVNPELSLVDSLEDPAITLASALALLQCAIESLPSTP